MTLNFITFKKFENFEISQNLRTEQDFVPCMLMCKKCI